MHCTVKHNMLYCDGGHEPSAVPQVMNHTAAPRRESGNNICQYFSGETSLASSSQPGHSFSKLGNSKGKILWFCLFVVCLGKFPTKVQ